MANSAIVIAKEIAQAIPNPPATIPPTARKRASRSRPRPSARAAPAMTLRTRLSRKASSTGAIVAGQPTKRRLRGRLVASVEKGDDLLDLPDEIATPAAIAGVLG